MKKRMIGMTRENKIRTQNEAKTETRRIGDRWAKVKKGDLLYVKKTMYSGYKDAIMILEVTKDTWKQRIREISARSCEAEGIPQSFISNNRLSWNDEENRWREDFRKLWDSINLKRGYGWHLNPEVWVIEYKLVKILRRTK
jgi:hypothetical protein